LDDCRNIFPTIGGFLMRQLAKAYPDTTVSGNQFFGNPKTFFEKKVFGRDF